MNVTTSSVNYGQEAMIASLSKKQQEQDGKTAMQLLQGAVQTVQASAPATPSDGSKGQYIDVHA